MKNKYRMLSCQSWLVMLIWATGLALPVEVLAQSALTLTQPTYDCSTGAITFNTSGGDGSPITYISPGITRSSATSNTGTVEQGLRNDPKPITIYATQNGQTVSYTFDLGTYCSKPIGPVGANLPDITLVVNQVIGQIVIGGGFRDPLNPYGVSASGLPPGLSLYQGARNGDTYIYWYIGITSNMIPITVGTYPVTITVVNARFPNDPPFVSSFKITVVDKPVVNPPTGGSLTLTQPTYNCSTGAITFNTSGGDGSPITYISPGITRSSATSNTGTVEQGLRNDPKPITIYATQNGQTVSYTFDFKAYCDYDNPLPPAVISPIPDVTLTVGKDLNPSIPLHEYFADRAATSARRYRTNLTFKASGLPPGLFLQDQSSQANPNAQLIGTPTTTGIYTVTVTATTLWLAPPDNSVSTTFKITVGNPPTSSTLKLLAPTVTCDNYSADVTFNTSGGDGSSITYAVPGVTLSSPTSNTAHIFQCVDPEKPLLIQAMQSGYTANYSLVLREVCPYIGIPKGLVVTQIPDLILPAGALSIGQKLPIYEITKYFSDPTFGIIFRYDRVARYSISIKGLPDGITYSTDGTTNGGVSSGLVVNFYGTAPVVPGVYTINITASNAYCDPVMTSFKIIVGDNPPTGGSLSLLAPTYNCSTGAITFNTSGGDGTPIEFQAAGITGWTTNPNQSVDKDSRTASDVKPFTLMARQSGQIVTYTWDLKAACGRARVGVAELSTDFSVQVLGNPAHEQVRVLIQGVEGQSVQLRLTDQSGRLLESRTVEQAGASEEQRFRLDQHRSGLLLLQATTDTQIRTVKIIKQ